VKVDGIENLGDAWEMEGVHASTLVEHTNVIVVAGMNPMETAQMAIGVGRAVSTRRTVTIADLWGDLPEVEALAGDHDGHGIADVLLFGASFERVRHKVPGSESLAVVTSGNDVVNREEVLLSERWEAVRSVLRTRGEVLLLTCRGDTPGLAALSEKADAVMLVGTGVTTPLANVVVTVRRAATTPAFLPTRLGNTRTDSAAAAASNTHAPLPEIRPLGNVNRWPVILLLTLTGAGALLLVAVFLASVPGQELLSRIRGVGVGGAVVQASGIYVSAAPEILNPHDSAAAALFAVEIAVVNTAAGAEMRLAEIGAFPGTTISPTVSTEGVTWYHVLAGAFHTREEAEVFYNTLRAREVQIADGDHIVQRPIALRLAVYPADSTLAAAEGLARYISLGVPAYLLTQTDGSLIAFAGAFERADQAVLFAELCAAKGIPARFVYRTGR
jgi:hypothetical protein